MGHAGRLAGLLTILVAVVYPTRSAPYAHEADRDTVVLLHGLGRTRLSMNWLANRMQQQGYAVMNIAYPSTRRNVADLADHLNQELQAREIGRARQVHFVTHSFGGIVVRAYLKRHRPSNLGRVVMLAPPNQGSELAHRLRGNWVFRMFAGPSGQELGIDPSSTPIALGAVDFPLGVIAGGRSWNPLFSAMVPGHDDGVVSVERTRAAGMLDFVVVRRSHTFIMRSSKVARQVVHFFEHGEFSRPST